MPASARISRALGPAIPNRAQFVADVGNLHIVHDDVALKNLSDGRRLRAVGGHQEIVAAVVGDQISLIASLRVQQEAVDAVVQRQIANVVGDHAIQPAHPVFAAEHQLGLPTQIKQSTALQQRAKFSRRVAVGDGGIGSAIASEARSRGRQPIL